MLVHPAGIVMADDPVANATSKSPVVCVGGVTLVVVAEAAPTYEILDPTPADE